MTKGFRLKPWITCCTMMPLAGCAAMLGAGKAENLYRFGVPSPLPAATTLSAMQSRQPVQLARIRFAPEIDGDGIMTSKGAQVQYLKGARWAAPASDLMTLALIRQFDRRAPSIDLTPFPARGRSVATNTTTLRVSIDIFEARYDPAGNKNAPPTIMIAGNASLENAILVGGDTPEHPIDVEEKASANTQSAVIAAFDRAVAKMTADITDWTVQSPRQGRRPGHSARRDGEGQPAFGIA